MEFFCNKCRRRIIAPKFLRSANVQGQVKLTCGYTNVNGTKCDGFALSGKKQKQPVVK